MNNMKQSVPGSRGTTVQEILTENGVQVLKVEVESGGEIPLHAHECAATMIVLRGSARALGKNSRIVREGDVVTKVPHEPHGFNEIADGFVFISVSNQAGIIKAGRWDLEYL